GGGRPGGGRGGGVVRGVFVRAQELRVVLGCDEGPPLVPVLAAHAVFRPVVGAVEDAHAASRAVVHRQRARVRDVAVNRGARLEAAVAGVVVLRVHAGREVDERLVDLRRTCPG